MAKKIIQLVFIFFLIFIIIEVSVLYSLTNEKTKTLLDVLFLSKNEKASTLLIKKNHPFFLENSADGENSLIGFFIQGRIIGYNKESISNQEMVKFNFLDKNNQVKEIYLDEKLLLTEDEQISFKTNILKTKTKKITSLNDYIGLSIIDLNYWNLKTNKLRKILLFSDLKTNKIIRLISLE